MPQVYITVLWVVAGGLLGVAVTVVSARIAGRNLLGKARREAAQTISNAERDAASILKEANTSIKEQRIQLREETERETREQRKELVALEKRILAKEETVDKRVETLERKANDLNARERELGDREKALDTERDKIKALVDEQTTTAIRLKRIEDEMVENSEKKAKWVITQAIQRCAADHVAEAVVSVVNLPNDEMKGRIIGREGRNIRVLEAATGINCIIDDTPEAVILSGFDPVRREIARISLERLIQDGRIHPARIEEVVQKVTEEMNQTIKENGERACLDTDIHGLHPEIVKLLGRLTYRTSYGQNVLRHSMEVCHLAGLMAAELGLPIHEAKRAALIHDIGKAINHEVEGSHAVIGHDLAKRYGENEHIANAIGSHHAEMEQSSVIAVLVQAADALSAARPGARRETLETYIKRLEQLEGIADGFSGVEKSYALQAGREIRVAVYPEKVTDAEASQLARDIARKVESEMTYPGQIKVTVIRETRAVDTAK